MSMLSLLWRRIRLSMQLVFSTVPLLNAERLFCDAHIIIPKNIQKDEYPEFSFSECINIYCYKDLAFTQIFSKKGSAF